jgi:predicted nuclease with TOPRIM domain
VVQLSLAEKLVEELEADEKTRKRLAIINAVLRDVATKEDIAKVMEEIENLRKEIYDQITGLRERVSKLEGAFTQLVDRIGDLDKRIDSLDKRIDYVVKVSWVLTGSVIATLVVQIVMRFLRIG